MDLSKKDRLILSYLLEVLEKVNPEYAESYAKHKKAIEYGFTLHYDWLTENLHEEMSEEQCREVLNILDMFRGIKFSYQALEDTGDITEDQIQFRGFDGNNEGRQLSYTHYFIEDLDRFREIQEYRNGYYNSHSPMLPYYRQMLQQWNELDQQEKHNMNLQQLTELLEGYSIH